MSQNCISVVFQFEGELPIGSGTVTFFFLILFSNCLFICVFIYSILFSCRDNERSQVAFVTFKDPKGAETSILLSVDTILYSSLSNLFSIVLSLQIFWMILRILLFCCACSFKLSLEIVSRKVEILFCYEKWLQGVVLCFENYLEQSFILKNRRDLTKFSSIYFLNIGEIIQYECHDVFSHFYNCRCMDLFFFLINFFSCTL